MLDDLDRLRSNPTLLTLLVHYADLAGDNRATWQDRVMEMEGVEPSTLVKLHGDLIAFGWIEQNTGQTPVLKPGTVAACYRVTAQGLRAIKQVETIEDLSEVA